MSQREEAREEAILDMSQREEARGQTVQTLMCDEDVNLAPLCSILQT